MAYDQFESPLINHIRIMYRHSQYEQQGDVDPISRGV